MSSPITSLMWMDECGDLTSSDFEPSLMTSGIVPNSVFDKFEWGNDFLCPDTDELLEQICVKNESECDILNDKNNLDFGSWNSIFPDLINDTKMDIDLKSILEPSENLSLFDDDKFPDIKDEPALDVYTPISTPISIPLPVPVTDIKSEKTTSVVVNEDKEPAVVTNSVIRIPVKRSPNSVNPNFSKCGTGRTVKAVVVCPDRSKSIVCNVVRSSNSKSIVIQKPVGRSLLNICGAGAGNRANEPKLPIKVNVITPKDAFARFKPTVATIAAKVESAKIEPEIKIESTPIISDVLVKTDYEEVRPETPLSLIGSDEEHNPFASPSRASIKNYDYQDNFIKSCLLDDENLYSDSYKCFPLAEVTGHVQPLIPDAFKYTPNSSPTNDDPLDTFYSKLTPNTSQNQFYNKAAANVDHDYGFTCRTPKTNNVFCADSLGIQTPSASEPPTDSDDDDVNLLSDSNLLNDYECSELDREQKEYFEQLKRQLKAAELVSKNREKENKIKSTLGSGVKERKNIARNRKRKSPYLKEKSTSDLSCSSDTKIKISLTSAKNDITKFSTSSATSTTGLLKVRLPAKDSSASKRRKTSSGGRVFSPSERHLHNTNEQVRRIEMRQSFEELRRLIPKLYDKPRAPKVSILQEAKSFCDELFHTDCKLQTQVTALKCQQESLRNSLSQLRRCAAASRY